MDASPMHFMTGMDHRMVRANGMRTNLRAFSLPDTIRSGLENHRAAASRDFEDDERDHARRLRCPVLTPVR